MPSILWTDTFLDEMRTKGDALADDVIARLFAEGKVNAVNQLMRSMVENDDIPSKDLPPYVIEYIEQTDAVVPKLDAARLRKAQELFALFGPEVMLVLGAYSLPATYSACKGVQVVYRSAFLRKRPVRRVFETAQLVVDVLSEGGMEPKGRGVATVQKVRLMHAAVRHLIRHDPNLPWNEAELGVPINQEDMAGTLNAFSFVVLEGLRALNIDLTREEQESYLYVWQAVGRILGLDDRLNPTSVEDARKMSQLIRRRHVAYSPEGEAMMTALIQAMQEMIPGRFLDGIPASMIRYFLDQDLYQGVNVADLMRVPKPDWTSIIPLAIREVSGFRDWVGDNTQVAARLLRFISTDLVEGMLVVERGGQRTPFSIPERLQDLWGLKKKDKNRNLAHRRVA
jgi:hypothetical protein